MHKRLSLKRRGYILVMKLLMWLSAGIIGALVLFLTGYVLYKGIPNISWQLISTAPSILDDTIGIRPEYRSLHIG